LQPVNVFIIYFYTYSTSAPPLACRLKDKTVKFGNIRIKSRYIYDIKVAINYIKLTGQKFINYMKLTGLKFTINYNWTHSLHAYHKGVAQINIRSLCCCFTHEANVTVLTLQGMKVNKTSLGYFNLYSL